MDKSQTLHWKVITVYIVKPLSGRPLKNTLNKSEICERLNKLNKPMIFHLIGKGYRLTFSYLCTNSIHWNVTNFLYGFNKIDWKIQRFIHFALKISTLCWIWIKIHCTGCIFQIFQRITRLYQNHCTIVAFLIEKFQRLQHLLFENFNAFSIFLKITAFAFLFQKSLTLATSFVSKNHSAFTSFTCFSFM